MIVMILGFLKVGGYTALMTQFLHTPSQSNSTRQCLAGVVTNDSICQFASCGMVPSNSLHIMRSADDPDLPWTGVIFGLTISAIWYWCSDQVIAVI